MTLTVLNVAYPLAPTGPDAVGGAEQVLTHLDTALTRAGQAYVDVGTLSGYREAIHLLSAGLHEQPYACLRET